jgi:FO synthase
MHAVARLALHGQIDNIQASWVKLGPEGVKACLNAGVNDLGGTLMNESITRAAGSMHGQETCPQEMEERITACNRIPRHRTTLYETVSAERHHIAWNAKPLTEIINTPLRKRTGSEKRAKADLIVNAVEV